MLEKSKHCIGDGGTLSFFFDFLLLLLLKGWILNNLNLSLSERM